MKVDNIECLKQYFANVFFYILCFFLTVVVANGQEQESLDLNKLNYCEVTFTRMLPQSTFGDKLGRNVSGFSINYLRQRKLNKMDFFGVNFDYYHLGNSSEVFQTFEERSGTNLMGLQGVYRLFPELYFWRIEPFIEGRLGAQFVYTVTTTTIFIDDTVDVNFDDTDFGITYGIGVGTTLYLLENAFLLFKINYESGTALTYLIPDDDPMGILPIENFKTETSSLDRLTWQLGLSFIF